MNEFMLGCNYWASNAGIEMWKNWDEDAVRSDFSILAEHGVKYLRVFPVWRDFQPVSPLFDYQGILREYRVNEDKLPENKYYLDETMLERFGRFCDIAQEFGLSLIVGLLTGWMSGRLFIPPALYGKNLMSDPVALRFEFKYIEGFVKRFKSKKSIYAWDLGNECNCMGDAKDFETAEMWTGAVSNAIRANDTRPIVSGMHSLSVQGVWRIEGQAEYTDMLTTHPYPYFVPHCSKDNFSAMRTLLHATCETKYYSDIGAKPCLVEELGNLGPAMCDDETAGNFLKVNMFSNWAHSATGVLWWCANDQIMLKTPPYCWNMCETELGLVDKNKNPKATLREMKKFSEWLKESAIDLPKATEDAVCIVTDSQDQWGAAYMTCLLAKQAKINLRYAYGNGEIPDSMVYMLPSVNSVRMMPAYKFDEIKNKVRDGATLYISNDDSVISEFKELTGVVINDTSTAFDSGVFEIDGHKLTYTRKRVARVSANSASVIARDENEIPIITKASYGKGTVYYVNFPVETMLLDVTNAHETDLYYVYRTIFAKQIEEHIADSDCKYIGITEHTVDETCAYVVMINYSDKTVETNITIKEGYVVEDVIRGDVNTISPFETVIFKASKK